MIRPLLCFVSAFFLLFQFDVDGADITSDKLTRRDPKSVGRIYQTLGLIDHLFKKHEITYWIDGGTLIGAVRHGGFIPWDYDADIEIFEESANKIWALEGAFARFGLKLIRTYFGFKIIRKR